MEEVVKLQQGSVRNVMFKFEEAVELYHWVIAKESEEET